MLENLMNFFKKTKKREALYANSKEAAKERLHLVLMQDRANVSADFLDLMRAEIIEVIKKYIDIDEDAMDVRLTNKENEDGTQGAPALYANIPIVNIKEKCKTNKKNEVIYTPKKERNNEENNKTENVEETKKEEKENKKLEKEKKEIEDKAIERENEKIEKDVLEIIKDVEEKETIVKDSAKKEKENENETKNNNKPKKEKKMKKEDKQEEEIKNEE